jgi:hypothetical protein
LRREFTAERYNFDMYIGRRRQKKEEKQRKKRRIK